VSDDAGTITVTRAAGAGGDGPHAPPDLTEIGHGGLQRVLGVPALFSTAYGNVGSSIYYALGLVAGFALGLTPVAFIISGFIFVATALTYAEATAAYPEAGGSSSFARHAFNEFVSFVTAWAQMLNYVITMVISAFFVPHYLAVFWKPLETAPGDIIGGCVVIAALALLNIVGVKETAALNIGLALADFGTQVLLALLGAFVLLDPSVLVANVNLGVAPTWTDFLVGVTVSMIAYTGIETISNMAEETRDPVRSVPRAIGWVVAAVLSLYIILPLVALSALPVTQNAAGEYETKLGLPKEQGGYAEDPFVGFVEQFSVPQEWMHDLLIGYVAVLAAVILIIATNAGVIGVSRLSYSMGQYQQVPDVLRRLHPRFLTPYISILIFSTIACLMLIVPPLFGLDELATLLGNLYAFGAMLSFSMAHVSLIKLRIDRHDMPWRSPLNFTVRGVSLPFMAFVGLFGTGSAWLVQVTINRTEAMIGLVWMLIGPGIYVWFRRSQSLDLTSTIRAPLVVEAPSAEVTYNNILVPVIGGRLDHAAMLVACKLAAERGAQILVSAVMEVPRQLPLHATLGDTEWQSNQQLDVARAIGQEFGVDVITRLVRARSSDGAVLEEALRRESQLIVLGVEPRRHVHRSLLGRTNERIIRKAPTRVLLVRERDDFTGHAAASRFRKDGGET